MKTPGDPKPQGTREPDPRPRVRETANGPRRWEGTAGEGLGAAVYDFWPPGEPLAAGALFKGKKWIFQQPQSLYCCTKGCIDECERSAWRGQSWVCSAGSLRLPFARGAQTVPGRQAPAIPPQALGSELVDKPRGSRHPGPRSQDRSRGTLGNQGCPLHPGSDLDSKCSRETAQESA